MYNDLVRVERDRREVYDEIRIALSPEIDAAKQVLDLADAAVEAAFDAINDHKAARYRETGKASDEVPKALVDAQKARKAERKEAAAAFKAARQAFEEPLKPAREAFKTRVLARAKKHDPRNATPHPTAIVRAKAEVLEEMLAEKWPDEWKRIAGLEDEAKTRAKAARARAVLSGACADDVTERFEAARMKRLKETGAPPKFRSFDGSGKIPAKLQKQGDRETSWSDLWSGETGAIMLRKAPPREKTPKTRRPDRTARTSARIPVPEERRYAIASVFVRNPENGDEARIELPVKLTKDLPHDAAIKRAWIRVQRRAGRSMYVLQLVAEHPSFAEPKRPAGVGMVAVHFGWRKRSDDGVRVATWLGSDGESGEIVLDARMMRMLDHPDLLQSFRGEGRARLARMLGLLLAGTGSRIHQIERDTRSDSRQAILRRICDEYAISVLGSDRVTALWSAWKAERLKLGTLGATLQTASRWARRHGAASAPERLAWYLWVWVRQDRHLREYESNERAAGANRRRYAVRHEGIRLATRYEILVTDSSNLAELAERKRGADAKDDAAEQARRQRKFAAPGACRFEIRDVFGPTRSVVVPAAGLSSLCADCGAELLGEKSALVRDCPTHGPVDVDRNACRRMLGPDRSHGGKGPGEACDAVAAE